MSGTLNKVISFEIIKGEYIMLKNYYDRDVKIEVKDGRRFYGIVTDYFEKEDNENGKESIVIESIDGTVFEFYEDDISSVTEL